MGCHCNGGGSSGFQDCVAGGHSVVTFRNVLKNCKHAGKNVQLLKYSVFKAAVSKPFLVPLVSRCGYFPRKF
jgi:hypothetical protein